MDGIFISYRRDDSAGYAGRLYDRLVGQFGPQSVFMDVEGIEPGLDFVEAIEQAVGSCRVLIVMIGDEWASMTDAAGRRRLDDPHDFIRLETGAALKRNIRVVPVLVGGAAMPRADELPDDLKALTRRQAIEINHKQWDASSGELIKALEAILMVAAPAGVATDAASPPPSPPSTPSPAVPTVGAALPGEASMPADAAAAPAAGAPAASVAQSQSESGHGRAWLLVAAAGALVAALWWVLERQSGGPESPQQTTAPAPASTDSGISPASGSSPESPVVAAAPTPLPGSASDSISAPVPEAAPMAPSEPSQAPASPIPPGPVPAAPVPAPAPAPAVVAAPATVPAPGGTSASGDSVPGRASATPDAARAVPPVIRAFTADSTAQGTRLCYRVSDARILELAPRPGTLVRSDQDCVTVQVDGPEIFTLTARNGKETTRRRMAVVPQPVAGSPGEPARAAVPPAPAGAAAAEPPPEAPTPGAASTTARAPPAGAPASVQAPVAAAMPPVAATGKPVVGERWRYRTSGKWRTSPRRRIEIAVRSVAGTVVTEALRVLEPATGGAAELRRSRGDKPDFVGWSAIGPEFSPYFGSFVDLFQIGALAGLATPAIDPAWSGWESRATVLGRESVQVPAGTFDSVKVEVWSTRRRTGSQTQARLEPVRVQYLVWYAPQFTRHVRMQRRVMAADGSESEKDLFELESLHRP